MHAGISANLAAFLRGMTKYDGYFHLLMGGALVGGILFMGTAGEAMWNTINKGVLPYTLAPYCHHRANHSCVHIDSGAAHIQASDLQKLFKDLPPNEIPARKKVGDRNRALYSCLTCKLPFAAYDMQTTFCCL